MDIEFHVLINKLVVVYLDDVTMFSKKRGDHLTNLWHIFDRCHKYGISLNPKKINILVIEGKLLGYLNSKEEFLLNLKKWKQ